MYDNIYKVQHIISVGHLTPCKLNDLNNGPCLKDLLQKILINGSKKNGIDPYRLKKALVSVDTPVVRLNMELKRIVILGMSQSKITDIR